MTIEYVRQMIMSMDLLKGKMKEGNRAEKGGHKHDRNCNNLQVTTEQSGKQQITCNLSNKLLLK